MLLLLLLILIILVTGGSFGSKSPRSKLVGFQLKKKLLLINGHAKSASACDEKEVIAPDIENSKVFMYTYNQFMDISILFQKYQNIPCSLGQTISITDEMDIKLMKQQFWPANEYFAFKLMKLDFTKLPAGKGDVFIFNAGAFVIIDHAIPGQHIERSYLQKGTYLKINESVRDQILISIPTYGLKNDVFYGVICF